METPMSKTRAFLLHLSLSATVVGMVCALIFFAWYPQPYFEISGAWSVLQVLIGVDLIAGPLLTLILYKPNKPKLIFDMSFIAVIQLTALIYGTTVIYQERPYYVVFAIDRFEVLARKEIDPDAIPYDSLREKPFIGPIVAVALFPESEHERQQLLTDVMEGKPDLERRPEYWDVYAKHSSAVLERATPLTELADKRPDARDRIDAFTQSRTDTDELIGIPVVGKKGAFCFVLNKTTRLPVGIINFDPWEAVSPDPHPG
jgi:hypothetical protein